MPFVKGKSGNPSGRPKEVRQVADAARRRTMRAIKTLTQIMETGTNEGARVRAAEALLDRGWGKAPQSVDVHAEFSNATELTREQLVAIAAGARLVRDN